MFRKPIISQVKMDLRKVFRGISKKLHSDFEISSQIKHDGLKGDYRENALREFLQNGRLPNKFGIGNGEIIGHIGNVSKQSDLIIFDQLNSIPLLYNTEIQIYPIDCIYGVIEVKSKLSKVKLLEGLENIKSVKELTPNDYITNELLFMKQTHKRPKPFGIVFGYLLDGNSLESLVKNLEEWEKNNLPEFWPNLVIILGNGIIFHRKDRFDPIIKSELFTEECCPTYIAYEDDSFFHFYSYLLDLCNNIQLPRIEISKYLDLPHLIGKYVVGNNDRIVKRGKDGKYESNHVYGVNEKFIDKIVTWCKNKGKMTHAEFFIKSMGNIPNGATDNDLKFQVYLYNPDNYKGIHEVEDAIIIEKGRAIVKEKLIIPSSYIVVDGETYYYPEAYVKDDDLEPIEGKTIDDL